MSEKKGLAKLKEDIKAIVEDLATLEVASFTGPEIDLNTGDADDDQKHKKVFETIRGALTTSTLVGYSRFEIEGDAMNYTNSDLGEGKKYLIDAHNSMVEGAQKSRKDFFDFVLNVING
ncbi:hypothetical protein [uncultured Kordia sp.]|uniref:hypothetical protein n=1 Tax=uncultured Kordia sp. TaxID=507699 RepID=UPI002636D36D|nr:hypothetical protein [uncultured Kordia sp.]